MAGAQEITAGLMRTRQVLTQQLEQTAGNLELLGEGAGGEWARTAGQLLVAVLP